MILAGVDAIDWHSVDAGGHTFSTGGNFSLGGTIGQHDAGPTSGQMIGGNFQLTGGFWVVSQVCHCPGDLNGDGKKDGLDVQRFITCLISTVCPCADVDQANGVTLADVPVFVNTLLGGTTCQ
jgi:hypothetical protein